MILNMYRPWQVYILCLQLLLNLCRLKININRLFQYSYEYHNNNTIIHTHTYTACEQPIIGMTVLNHYVFNYFLWKHNVLIGAHFFRNTTIAQNKGYVRMITIVTLINIDNFINNWQTDVWNNMPLNNVLVNNIYLPTETNRNNKILEILKSPDR
jgi:hypothetical protein